MDNVNVQLNNPADEVAKVDAEVKQAEDVNDKIQQNVDAEITKIVQDVDKDMIKLIKDTE